MTEARRTQTASASFGTIIGKQTQHAKNTKAAQTARGALTFSEQTEKCAIQHESTRKQQGHAFLLKTNSQTFKTKREGAEKLFRTLALLAERRLIIYFAARKTRFLAKLIWRAKTRLYSNADTPNKNAFFIHQRSIAPHICADYCLFVLSSSVFKTSEFANTSEFVSS